MSFDENSEDKTQTLTDCYNFVPVCAAEMRYIHGKFLVENANSYFFESIKDICDDFFEKRGFDYRSIVFDEDWMNVENAVISCGNKPADVSFAEYRVHNKTGKLLWTKMSCLRLLDDSFGGIRLSCVFENIDSCKKNANRVQNEIESFYAIASLTNVRLFEYEIADDEIKDITGGRVNSFLRNFSTVIFDYDIFADDGSRDRLVKKLKSGEKKFYLEISLKRNADFSGCYGIWGKTIFDFEGRPVKVIGKSRSIQNEKKRLAVFENRADFDNLTGLYTGFYVSRIISERLEKSVDCSHGLIVFDIDDFSEFNTSFSIVSCNELIYNLSKYIKDIFADDDIIGRIGGDEFIVYIDNVISEDFLRGLIYKIKDAFAMASSKGDNKFSIKASIGAVIIDKGCVDFENAFEKADYSLHISKSVGEDNFYIFSEKDNEPFMNKLRKHSTFGEKFIYKKDEYADREFNSEIVEFVFDVMESTNNVDSVINILLYKTGSYFDLSRIVIREAVEENCQFVISYQWCGDFFEPTNSKFFSIEKIESLFSRSGGNNVFVYSEYPGFERGAELKEYIDDNIKSSLLFVFKEDEKLKEIITFEDSENRVWRQDEIKSLNMVGKIISSYLIKMRVFKEAKETAERLTSYDSLTGVMKYDMFICEALRILENDSLGQYAIVYSDIGNFKYINERYGYKQGDKILRDFIANMRKERYSLILVSRVFSDNFVAFIKLDENVNKDNIKEYIDEYDKYFSTLQEKNFSDIKIKMISGIYIISDRTEKPDKGYLNRIIDNANVARKYAKSILAEKSVLFDSEMEKKVKKQIEILTSMEKALVNNEFIIVLQPKVNLREKNIVGAEALVRWVKDDGKIIPPMDFIPIFEKNGFVVNVDFCVYEQVCKFLSQRIAEGKRVVPVSVNVSRLHLEKGDFIERIENLVQKYNIPRELLEFELTENVFLQNSDKAIQVMNTLRDMNFKVSMDDFGSGYSSLNLLKKLPVDILKMDKGFLDNDEIKGNDEVVIKSIIDMAKKMKIIVLCEGVETKKQADFLLNAGCDLAQGYYFSKPVKIEEFKNMI